jgi:hypothetical protein
LSAAIDVRCEPAADGWSCHVEVSEGASATRHVVSVSAAELARLAPGATDPTDLVERSFRFLLAREPASSILPRFGIAVIGRYFAEYEQTILA